MCPLYNTWRYAITDDCSADMLEWCVYDRDLIYNLDYIIKTYRTGLRVEHRWYFKEEENAILFALRW